jgi:hypothetical protein
MSEFDNFDWRNQLRRILDPDNIIQRKEEMYRREIREGFEQARVKPNYRNRRITF